ncbi:MAG: hypothetical protein ACFFKA_12870 [Candidatus Thorarchaeota archaeon]
MVNSHSLSFFGQNTGIILASWSKDEPFLFLSCIKMKSNGKWEKITKREGKTNKISLEEVILILRVLNREISSWQTSHFYKDKETSISFSWQDENKDILWINIDNYSKMLNSAQVEVLRLLTTHLLHEKIIYSTTLDNERQNLIRVDNNNRDINDNIYIDEEFITKFKQINEVNPKVKVIEQYSPNSTDIESLILSETEKALMLKIGDDGIWIPKSTVLNQYDPVIGKVQSFLISNWILARYKIIP